MSAVNRSPRPNPSPPPRCCPVGRVELGIGVGWSRGEFAVLGAHFDHRGARTGEMVALMRALWEPGWTEFHGTFYRVPRLEMSPTPPPIPILVGGLSNIALRRAAGHDGWIGDLMTTDQAVETATVLHRIRRDLGEDGEFRIVAPLIDATGPDDYQRAADAGVRRRPRKRCDRSRWLRRTGGAARRPAVGQRSADRTDTPARPARDLAFNGWNFHLAHPIRRAASGGRIAGAGTSRRVSDFLGTGSCRDLTDFPYPCSTRTVPTASNLPTLDQTVEGNAASDHGVSYPCTSPGSPDHPVASL